HSNQQCRDHREHGAGDEASGQGRERGGEIGADHVERAVRQIDQVHDAEDQRQPGRQQKQQHAELDAVQGLFDQIKHPVFAQPCDPRPLLRNAAPTRGSLGGGRTSRPDAEERTARGPQQCSAGDIQRTAEAHASAVPQTQPTGCPAQFGILHFCQCLSWSFSTMVATVLSRYSLPSFTASWSSKFCIGLWVGPNLKLARTYLKSAFSAARRISSFLLRSPLTALTTLSSSGTAS